MHTIGDRLRAWREHFELSQKDASTRLRVPGRTYQDYERGVRSPGAESMEAFARAGINANWLLTGEGPMLLSELDEQEGARNLLKQAVEQRDALAGSLQEALENTWAQPAPMSAAPLESGAAEKMTADERAARSETSWITDPSDEDRLQMLLILLRTMEHRLRTPVEHEVAARMLDAVEAWREFARNRPEILARLEAVRTAAAIYLDP